MKFLRCVAVSLPFLVSGQDIGIDSDAPAETGAPKGADAPAESDFRRAQVTSVSNNCGFAALPFSPNVHKTKYRVGIDAIRGDKAAYAEFNQTFGEYLTKTAGAKFETPITFEMVPLSFGEIYRAIDNDELDFFFGNPSIYSCIGVEVGASPLATIISHLEVRGRTFNLDVFGGVIMTHAENRDIKTVGDLQDKVIGAEAMDSLMAGQLQFQVMAQSGLSYVKDPKQVMFTGNQNAIVQGVLNKEFDVGFVRTGQIELSVDKNGEPIDPDLFKVLDPRIFILDDGDLFPFLHSTPIYPEWPLAALPGVPIDVAEQVQDALFAIEHHAHVGKAVQACQADGTTDCDSIPFPYGFDPDSRCDTTKDIAKLSAAATEVGKFAGFRTSRSYFEVRSMQQDTGLLKQNNFGQWKCSRPASMYESIVCPEGYYKRNKLEYEEGCADAGLACKEGYDCFCKPCVKAFEVDVYEYAEGDVDDHLNPTWFGDAYQGCEKMSVCGTVQQSKSITIRIYDNKLRENAKVTVMMHSGATKKSLPVVRPYADNYAYDTIISENNVAVVVFEVAINGVPIAESPMRIQVEELDCDAIYGESSHLSADEEGNCVCEANSYLLGGKCVRSPFFFLMIFAVTFIAAGICLYVYLSIKRKQGDSVWHVKVEELQFDDPPDVIGQGAFGVVYLAEYRGTKVAVKRVIPAGDGHRRRSVGSNAELESSVDGSLEDNVASTDIEAGVNSIMSDYGKRSSQYLDIEKIVNTTKGSSFGILNSSGNTSVSWGERSKKNAFYLGMICPKFDEQSRLRRQFIDEMRLLSSLRHPCITTVMGAVISPLTDPMLVMEYMEYGSLYDVLHNETMYFGGEIILQIMRDISQGIRYLHSSKPPIVHGDLKAKNILIDSRFRAKVCDFGLSEKKGCALQGTPFYMAPEYLRKKTEYTSACDMYSMGMIVYEIYSRKTPFEGQDPKKVLPLVCNPRKNLRPPVPDSCPPKMADIMKKCLSADPFFRPGAKDLDYALMDVNSQETEPLTATVQAFKNLNREKKSEKEILYEVFPKHIADALNAGQKVEPESHDCVTVFFSDIVGFTSISAAISPLKVSQMLDRLYLVFDSLSREHKIFKVETIGDSYMGVTNLNASQEDDHAKRIAEFAIAVIEATRKILVDEEDPSMGFIHIRVGFHSGPVVTNVIGSMNPRYGLFGDTVNTASRMESNSKEGLILCSHKAAQILRQQAPDIALSKRAKIGVKGKGDMTTYWVGKDELSVANVQDQPLNSRVYFQKPESARTEAHTVLQSGIITASVGSYNLQIKEEENEDDKWVGKEEPAVENLGRISH